MAAGKLDQRIELQEPVRTRDEMGGTTAQFVTRAGVWACVEPLSGRELWTSRQARPDVTTRITIRFYPGLALGPTWQVKLGMRTYQIDSVINPAERGEDSVLMCKEVL